MITLPPFKAFLASNIPSVYDNTLTYYEELVKLIAYLEQQVVPQVNKNTADIQTYVDGLKELKEYVDHYFDNLDVQEEINNKLDAMAESGDLATIIAQFLAMAPVFGYGTIAQMAAAENLANGSIARVLGNTSASAGNGAYYMIRTREAGDNPDGTNLVSIGDDLVGVRVQDAAINHLQDEIDSLTEKEEIIIMGDSYGAGEGSWIDDVINKIGDKATCHKIALGGLGFYHQSSLGNYTFKTYLQSQASTIEHPNKIKKIIVCGGYNDYNESTENLISAISSFCEYCKDTYANAQVYIGMIGFNGVRTEAGAYVRTYLGKKILYAYSYNQPVEYAPIFIENTPEILKNTALLGSDGIHPNSDGQAAIAKAVYNWYLGGNIQADTETESIVMPKLSNGDLKYQRGKQNVHIYSMGPLVFTYDSPITINSGVGSSGYTVIDTFTAPCLFPSLDGECLIPVSVSIISDGTTYRNVPMYFGLRYDGTAVLYNPLFVEDTTTARTFENVSYIRIENPFVINLDKQFN